MEIELKLGVPESAQRSLLRHPLLKQASGKSMARLVNIYFDTPELDLQANGIALRLRRQGRLWLQTVKCAGQGSGGLSARPEWESPYHGRFDFSVVDDEAVRHRLMSPEILAHLTPLFETNFLRHTWRFDGAVLTLDRGYISAGEAKEAISEIEIELAGGEIAQLFALAEALALKVPFVPALRSKAERGFRLRDGAQESPTKSYDAFLDKRMAPLAAFRAIALNCLEHLQANHRGVLETEDPEYIHQMRVAARRFRACLRLFKPCLPADFVPALLPPLRSLMAFLGQTRDLDVLDSDIVGPVLASLPTEPRLLALSRVIIDRKNQARALSQQHLASTDFGVAMLKILSLLYKSEFLAESELPESELPSGRQIDQLAAGLDQPSNDSPEPPLPQHCRATVAEFAANRLTKLRRNVRRLHAESRIDDPTTLHELRIGIKRLRYALEFFNQVGKGKTRRALALQLANLQGTLGQLNDLASAGRLLMDCAGNDPALREAISLIAGWHGPRHTKLMRKLPKLLTTVKRMPKLA